MIDQNISFPQKKQSQVQLVPFTGVVYASQIEDFCELDGNVEVYISTEEDEYVRLQFDLDKFEMATIDSRTYDIEWFDSRGCIVCINDRQECFDGVDAHNYLDYLRATMKRDDIIDAIVKYINYTEGATWQQVFVVCN